MEGRKDVSNADTLILVMLRNGVIIAEMIVVNNRCGLGKNKEKPTQ